MDTAWLIEFPPANGEAPSYWGKVITGIGCTAEHLDAIRFSRKEDAETVIRSFGLQANAVEHAWEIKADEDGQIL